MHRHRRSLKGKAIALLCLFAGSSSAQTTPAKEYIRLGGRVIAIESTLPAVPPAFSIVRAAESVTVVAGSTVGNQINLSSTNFTGTVTFTASLAPSSSSISPSFFPSALSVSGSTAITLTVPSNTAPGIYVVTVTGTTATLSPQTTVFNVNVLASTAGQSVVFGAQQSLAGSVPANIDSLTSWRYEFRLHDFQANQTYNTTNLVTLGASTLGISFYPNPYSFMYTLQFSGGGSNTLSTVLTAPANDIFVRVQRSGSDLTLNVWQVESNGSYTTVGTSSSQWSSYNAASLAPGFTLGANAAAGLRLAFFRFYDSAIVSTTAPNLCDSSPAFLRYEFNGSLANTGSATAATLVNLGTAAYQPTPNDSCTFGGGTPGFQLVSGAQSPSSVAQGASATYPITINRQNFPGLVTFGGCSGAPAGVTCSAPATSANSAQVTVTTSAATPVATHSLTLNATASGVPGASAPLSLLVTAPSTGSLALTAPTTLADVRPGYSTSTTFAINSTGITAPVQISCFAASAAGATCPATTVNVVPGANNVTLPINIAPTATGGTYSLTINAAAVGLNVTAPAVSAALTVIQCALANLNSTPFPLNPGVPLLLGMNCTPAAAPGDTINWQLLNSSGQQLNTGNATGAANSRQFIAPANSTTGLLNFVARATYSLSPLRTADFPFSVNPPQGLTIYPQSNPPYVVNPLGQLIFGIIASGPVTCSVPQGTLTNTPPPGYAYGYIYTAPTVVGQLSLSISCFLVSNPAIRDSFPFLVNDALSVPPSVTSVVWNGFGNTASFQSVVVQGTHPLPAAQPQAVSLLVSPSDNSFSLANSCFSETYAIAYGSPLTSSWRLWDNAGTSAVNDSSVYSYYLYPTFYNINYRQNSQCQSNYHSQENSYQSNYGPAQINYSGNTIMATFGLRYLTGYVGMHSVWGQITLYTGLQSAWTQPLAAPTKMTVQ